MLRTQLAAAEAAGVAVAGLTVWAADATFSEAGCRLLTEVICPSDGVAQCWKRNALSVGCSADNMISFSFSLSNIFPSFIMDIHWMEMNQL